MYDLGISRWHPDPQAAIEERKTAIERKKDRSRLWKRLR
jgi:hypothetical protein